MGKSGDFEIYYDEKLVDIATKISASLRLDAQAVKFSSDMGLTTPVAGRSENRNIVIWSIMPPYDRDMFKLCLVLSKLGPINVLVLLPMAYQKGGSMQADEGFSQYIGILNQFNIQRIIFVDMTPIKRLGMTTAESVSLSTFPVLIEQLKSEDYRSKVITFNPDLDIAASIIERQVGVKDNNVLIIDNLVSNTSEFIPVASVYLKRADNVRFYATYYLDDPAELKSFGTVMSSNTVPWDVKKLDISEQIISHLKTLY